MNKNIEQIEKVVNKIKNSRTIAIFIHNSPDGDCIGTAAALEEACKQLGKNVELILHDKVNEKYAPIIGNNRVNKIILPKEGKIYDLAILLDCSDFNRTYSDIKKISKFLIVIDHHPIKYRISCDIYLYRPVSATAIIVYDIIKRLIKINSKIATGLYFAIVSDTNYFSNDNVDSLTHKISSNLIYYGANLQIIREIINSRTLEFYNLLSLVIPNIQYNEQYKIVSLIITREQIRQVNAHDSDASLIIDYIKNIKDCEVALLFIEGVKNVRIRARSKNIKINKVLEYFGGGGHDKAAGCAIYYQNIKKVYDDVINYTINYIKNLNMYN